MGQKKKTGGENNNNKNDGDAGKKDDNPITVVLKVDMHCEGCASKIIRYLRAFQGVETVKAKSDTGNITVTGKVDPTKMRDKLMEKMKRKVELLSPQPKKEKEKEKEKENENKDKKSENKNDDKKPKDKEPPVTTAVLKLALHCQGCIDKISKTVLKTKGVHNMSINREMETITVKGTMDVKALVGNLMEKLKRKVEVVPPKKDKDNDKDGGGGGDKEGGKKKNKGGGGGGGDNNNKDEEGGGKMEQQGRMDYLAPPPFGFAYGYGYGNANVAGYGYNYVPVYPEHLHLHAPQMFSDENPNACTVM